MEEIAKLIVLLEGFQHAPWISKTGTDMVLKTLYQRYGQLMFEKVRSCVVEPVKEKEQKEEEEKEEEEKTGFE